MRFKRGLKLSIIAALRLLCHEAKRHGIIGHALKSAALNMYNSRSVAIIPYLNLEEKYM